MPRPTEESENYNLAQSTGVRPGTPPQQQPQTDVQWQRFQREYEQPEPQDEEFTGEYFWKPEVDVVTPEDVGGMSFPDIQSREQYMRDLRNKTNQFWQDYNFQPPAENPNWDYKNPPISQNGKPMNQLGEELPYGAQGWTPIGTPYFGPGVQGWGKHLAAAATQPYKAPNKNDDAPLWQAVQNVLKAAVSVGVEAISEPSKVTESFLYLRDQYPWLAMIYPANQLEMAEALKDGFQTEDLPKFAEYMASNLPIAKPFIGMKGFVTDRAVWDITGGAADVGDIAEDMRAKWGAGRIAYTGLLEPVKLAEAEARIRAGEDPRLVEMELQNPWAEMVGTMIFDPLNALGVGPAKELKRTRWINSAERLYLEPVDEIGDALRALSNAPTSERALDAIDGVVKAQMVEQQQLASAGMEAWLRKYGSKHGLFDATAGNRQATITDMASELLHNIAGQKDADTFADVIEAMYKMGSDNADEVADGLFSVLKTDSARLVLSKAGQTTVRVMRQVVGDNLDEFLDLSRAARTEGIEAYTKFVNKRVTNAIVDLFPTVTQRANARAIVNAVNAGRKYSDVLVDIANKTISQIEDAAGKGSVIVEEGGDLFYKVGDDMSKMSPDTERMYRQAQDVVELARSDPQKLNKVADEEYRKAFQMTERLGQLDPASAALDKVYQPMKRVLNFFMGAQSTVYMGLSYKYALRNAWNNYFTNFADEGIGAVFGSAKLAEERTAKILGQMPARMGGLTTLGPVGEWGTATRGWTFPEKIPLIGGKPLLFGTAMADTFERSAAAKVMYTAAKNAMERLTKPGRAIPSIDDMARMGLPEDVGRAFARAVRNFDYNVDEAVEFVSKMLADGEVDYLRTMNWMPPTVRDVAVRLGIDDELVKLYTKSDASKDEIFDALKDLREAMRRDSRKVNDLPGGVPLDGEEAQHLAELELDFGLKEKDVENVMDYVSANSQANNAAYKAASNILQSVLDAVRRNPELARNDDWNDLVSALSKINGDIARAAPGSIYTQVRNRVVRLKKMGYGKNEDVARLWQELLDEPITLPGELANTPYGEAAIRAVGEVADRGRNVFPTTPRELASAAWEDWWYPRMRRIWSSYRDSLSETVGKMFERANQLLDRPLPESMLAPLEDAMRQARAFDTDIYDEELASAFSAAFRRGDIPGMIRTRARAWGISSPSDKKLVNIINKRLTGDINASAVKKLRERQQKILKAYQEYENTLGGLDESDAIVRSMTDVEEGRVYSGLRYIEKLYKEGKLHYTEAGRAAYDRFKPYFDAIETLEAGRPGDLSPDIAASFKDIFRGMLDELAGADKGERFFFTPDDMSQPKVFGVSSSYPEWYGENGYQLYSNAKYWDASGKQISGREAVEECLKDLANGNAKKSALQRKLTGIALGSYDAQEPLARLVGVPYKAAEADWQVKLKQIQRRWLSKIDFDIKNEDDVGRIYEEISADIVKEMEKYADQVDKNYWDRINKSPDFMQPSELSYHREMIEIERNTLWEQVADLQTLVLKRMSGLAKKVEKDPLAKWLGQTYTKLEDVPYEIVDDVFRWYADSHPTESAKIIPAYRPYNGGPPTPARVLKESRETWEALFDFLMESTEKHYGRKIPVVYDGKMRAALNKVAGIAGQRMQEARMVATKVADASRDFALLDYRKRYGFDLALSFIYPYHYWYGRTFMNWGKRMVYSPEVWAAWAKYRKTMEAVHSDAPEWWRYNFNTADLLGADTKNPLFFNLEQTLWPLYGLTSADFDDPQKRTNALATTLDEIDNFGASPWTWFGWVNGLDALRRGETEAASKYFGRLIPQTKDIRNFLSIIGKQYPSGSGYNDYDPMILAFSKGVDPYDNRMIARALAFMQVELEDAQRKGEEYPFTMEELYDGARSQSGPAWDEAVKRMLNYRATGGIQGPAKWIPFVLSNLGAGFKPRTQEDLMIDQYDMDKLALIRGKGNFSPDDYREEWKRLNERYPFAELLSLARGAQADRDEAYVYNVLNRIPPGQSREMYDAFGISYNDVLEFYDSKGGALRTWSKERADKFLSDVVVIGTVLGMPDNATRQEWDYVSGLYRRMNDIIDERFGTGMSERMYGVMDTQERLRYPDIEQARRFRDDYIQAHPEMLTYYSSASKTWGYYKSKAYKKIEEELGPDIFSSWAQRSDAQIAASDALNEWDKTHPEWDNTIVPLLEQRRSMQEQNRATIEAAFEEHPWLKDASKLSETYDKKIKDHVKQTYGLDLDEVEAEWDAAWAASPFDGGQKYYQFVEKYGEFWNVMSSGEGYASDETINALRDERNMKMVEKYGDKWGDYAYSTVWNWFSHFSKDVKREVAMIDAQFEAEGWWDLLDERSVLRDAVDAAGQLTPQQKRYIELRDMYIREAAESTRKSIEMIKPVRWPEFRRGARTEIVEKVGEVAAPQQQEVYSYTWNDWQKEMSPVLQRVVQDYFLLGDELPWAAEDALERIADQNNIDYNLMLEQIRQSIQ